MRRFAILIGLYALSGCFAHAAISRNGTVAATGTSGTFSGTATGSLKIAFAFRSGSTTAPTCPATYTCTSTWTAATASGGTPGSWRAGCEISTSGADTGTGTWTNATSVSGNSYVAVPGLTTAMCAKGVGGIANNSAKASTTANFPTIAMTHGDNTSWVLGFLGDSASSVCTPSGMTQTAATGTIEVNDTNATASSWSSTNCSVSSSTWMTFVLEILSPCSAANVCVVQAASAATIASGTTVAVTIAANSAGNLLSIVTGNNGTRTVTGVTDNAPGGSNTYTCSPTGAHAVNSNRETDACYGLNPIHAGATTITVQFSGVAGTDVREAAVKEVSGFTAAQFDLANNSTGTAGTTTLSGASVTTTSTKGFVDGNLQSNNSVTSNPLAGNEFLYGGNIFPTSADGNASLVSTTAAAHQPQWLMNATGSTFAATTIAFRETPASNAPTQIGGFLVGP